jgi:tRNA nucleotidyltransferase (CCA-adding enzyme)
MNDAFAGANALDPTAQSSTRWEHFDHGADIGIRGIGKTMAESFEQAATALTAVLTNPDNVLPCSEVRIECGADDPERLLVEWLNAVIYQMATRRMVFGRFRVELGKNRLWASAWGEEIDPVRHEPAVEVKGATYTSLYVGQNTDSTWMAQCVVDV